MILIALLVLLSILAQVPSLNYPAGYIVGSTVLARRVISFATTAGTTTISPHVGSGPANGITLSGGATGVSVPIVSYGNTICEFDAAATLGNIAGINGDRCHDTGQTSLDNISNALGVLGNILIANPSVCGNCYTVSIVGPLEVGRMIITIPAGLIMLILSGTCPAGFSEVSALNGRTLVGTLAANGNVGTTGGADTITPAGTVAAPIFSGSVVTSSAVSAGTPAGSVSAPTFTGSSAISSAVSAGTPAGTVSAPTFTGAAMAGHAHELPFQLAIANPQYRQLAPTIFGTGTSRAAAFQTGPESANTTSAPVALSQSVSAGTPTGTNSAPTFIGSALGTHTHSVTATGTNSAPAFSGSALPTHTHDTTATGTNSAPGFSGTSFDNRSAFVRVIFCSKN